MRGYPNCGKGTLAEALSLATGSPRIVVSDLVRARCKVDPVLAKKAAALMKVGKLLGDEDINPLVQEAVEALPGYTDVFLDGTSRTAGQFVFLRDLLLQHSIVPLVLKLKLSRKSANARRLNRRRQYIARGEKPRKDDKKKVFYDRLDIYDQEEPLIDAQVNRLHPSFVYELDAEVGPDELLQATMEHFHFKRKRVTR